MLDEETERLWVTSYAAVRSWRQEELCSSKRTFDTSNQAGNLEEKPHQVPPEYKFCQRWKRAVLQGPHGTGKLLAPSSSAAGTPAPGTAPCICHLANAVPFLPFLCLSTVVPALLRPFFVVVSTFSSPRSLFLPPGWAGCSPRLQRAQNFFPPGREEKAVGKLEHCVAFEAANAVRSSSSLRWLHQRAWMPQRWEGRAAAVWHGTVCAG